MRLLITLPLLWFCAACSHSGTAAVPAVPAAPPAVAEYLSALSAIEKSTTPISLEALLDKAEVAQSALMEISGSQALLERYTDAEFSALQAQMRGLTLHRGADIYAQPEPAFFLSLAKAHGRTEDVAFFTLYAGSWGPDLVPTYLKLRPQPTPCVRFGEGRIAPLYAGWRGYATLHPAAYQTRVTENLRDLEEAVALGTCACDGAESVLREQAEFLKRFPDTPQAAAIKARREQLLSHPDVLPVNCR